MMWIKVRSWLVLKMKYQKKSSDISLKRNHSVAVFRDSSFANSADKINVSEIFKELSPHTK